jgi:hypothetical protein
MLGVARAGMRRDAQSCHRAKLRTASAKRRALRIGEGIAADGLPSTESQMVHSVTSVLCAVDCAACHFIAQRMRVALSISQ